MLDYLSGTPRRLDVGFVPDASGGQFHFWQDEEQHNCFIVINGYAPDIDTSDRIETSALIIGVGCVQSVVGYPNEDAFWKDPRGELGHGCFEIEDSKWQANIDDYNRRSFGDHYRHGGPQLHHYFVGSKDGSCQILASSLEVELFPGRPWWEIVRIVYQRQAARFAETLRVIRQRQEHSPRPE
jgi:hypothetical protein